MTAMTSSSADKDFKHDFYLFLTRGENAAQRVSHITKYENVIDNIPYNIIIQNIAGGFNPYKQRKREKRELN